MREFSAVKNEAIRFTTSLKPILLIEGLDSKSFVTFRIEHDCSHYLAGIVELNTDIKETKCPYYGSV